MYLSAGASSMTACCSFGGRARFLLKISEFILSAKRGAEIPKQMPKFSCIARSRSMPCGLAAYVFPLLKIPVKPSHHLLAHYRRRIGEEV